MSGMRDSYERLITRHGFNATFSRPGHDGEYTVKIMRRYMESTEFALEMDQESLEFKVPHQPLVNQGFTTPVKKGDKIKESIFGITHTVQTAEPHIVEGACIGYTVRCGPAR